jgi:3-methyladenine DNA glycosylase/8-oxoguanine DNA glycosylase
VSVVPPYDFDRSTFRFRVFGDDLASRWHEGGLHRVMGSGLAVRVTAAGPTWFGIPTPADEAELAHLQGMSFDVAGLIAAYPDVAARAPGFRPPLLADPFEMLATSVTAQQISLLAASAIRNRFIRRFGHRVEHDGFEWFRFPTAEAVRGGDLTELGLSQSKIRTITALSEADLDVKELPDAGIRARLIALPGIGPWTVDWFLARCLGRPDAFAPGDLGVRKAVAQWFSEDPIWPQERVREAITPFGRHANLAVHYLLLPEGG